MAQLGGGPAADAPVGVDVLAATAEPRVALKSLRKEIAAAERELAQLVKDGANITAQAANLKKLETQYKYVEKLDKQNRDAMARSKQAIAMGKLANAMFTAQAIGNIARGGADIQSTLTLATMAMQHEKAITKAFGAKGWEYAQQLAPALHIFGAGMSVFQAGWKEKQRLESDMASIGTSFRRGQLSKEQELYAQQVLTETWFEDPKATIAAAEKMGKALGDLPAHKLREVLGATKIVNERARAGRAWNALAGASYDDNPEDDFLSIDADAFMADFEGALLYERQRQGRMLKKDEQTRVLINTATKYGRERQWTQKQIEDYASKLEKSDALDMVADLGHRMKFMDDLRLQQDAARLRARHIPARLEY